MFRLLSKSIRSAASGYYFMHTQQICALSNYYNSMQFSWYFDPTNQFISHLTRAETENDKGALFALYGKHLDIYTESGELSRAVRLGEHHIRVAESILGLIHPKLEEFYIYLALSFRTLKFHKNSVEYFEKALKIGTLNYGEKSEEATKILIHFSNTYEMAGGIVKAEEGLKKASKYIYEHHDEELYALCLCSFGALASSKNEYDKAIEYYKEGREILKSISWQCAYETCSIDTRIGDVYRKMKLYEKALQYYQSSINNHPSVVDPKVFSDIITLYKEMGYDNEANKWIEKTVAGITEAIIGQTKIITDVYTNLNTILIDFYTRLSNKFQIENDFENSKKYCEKALKALKNISSQYSLNIVDWYEKLINIFRDINDWKKVISLTQKILRIKSHLGFYDELYACEGCSLGQAYYWLKDYEKAERYLLQAKEWLEKPHSDKIVLARCVTVLALLYKTQQKYAKSIKLFQRGIELKCEILGRFHPETAEAFRALGDEYLLLGSKIESIECLRAAVEIYDQIKGRNNANSANLLIQIGELHCSIGKYEKAVEDHKKAIKIKKAMHDQGLGKAYYCLAEDYKWMGIWDKARSSNEKGIQSDLTSFGDHDPRPGRGYYYLGLMFEAKGDKDAAIDSYKKSENFFLRLYDCSQDLINTQAKIEELTKEIN